MAVPLSPPLALLGAYRTPGPVVILTSQLGPAVSAAALIGEWTVGRIASVALVKQRSSYRGSPSILLSGVRDPLPLALAPDGSVLIGDRGTGIIYRVARRA